MRTEVIRANLQYLVLCYLHKRSTLLGMSQQRSAGADDAIAAAKQQAMEGVGTMVGGLGAGVSAGNANLASGGDATFWKSNKNV